LVAVEAVEAAMTPRTSQTFAPQSLWMGLERPGNNLILEY